MNWFECNAPRKGSVLFLLSINSLCLLYCLHWVCCLDGWALVAGSLMLALWVAVVFSDEIRMILYDRRQIGIAPDGIHVGKKKTGTIIPWATIREVEVRDGVGIGSSYWGNSHLVFSTQPLSDAIRGFLCTDLEPWLKKNSIITFRFAAVKEENDTTAILRQECPLFVKAEEVYPGRFCAYATGDQVVLDTPEQFAKRTRSAKSYTTFAVLRDFVWFWVVLASERELSDKDTIIYGTGIIIIFWLATLLCTAVCTLFRQRALQRVNSGNSPR